MDDNINPAIMEVLVYDSVPMETGVTEYRFFGCAKGISGDADRYSLKPESEVLNWMVQNQFDCDMGLTRKHLRIPNSYKFHVDVSAPVVSDKDCPGDIDLLAIDPLQPHKSIGIQVKRIRANIKEDGTPEMKTRTISKGVTQVRGMIQNSCFHRNYLMFLLVADTQFHSNDSYLFRQLPPEKKMKMYSNPLLKELPPEAGLYTYEISQTSEKPIYHSGMFAAKELHPAALLEQPAETTEKIVEYLRMHESRTR